MINNKLVGRLFRVPVFRPARNPGTMLPTHGGAPNTDGKKPLARKMSQFREKPQKGLQQPVWPSQQRGISMLGWAGILAVVAVLGTAAFRMVPAYLENNTINTAIKSLMQDSRTALMSPREVRSALSKRFTINQVDVIKVSDLEVSKEGGVLSIGTDYEVREKLFYNVSIVMTFQDEYNKDARQ